MAVTVIYDHDSFDQYTALALRYETVSNTGTAGVPTTTSSAARGGSGKGVRLTCGGSTGSPVNSGQSVRKTLPAGNISTAISLAIGMRISSYSSGTGGVQRLFSLQDATTDQLTLTYDTSGHIVLKRGSSAGTVLATSTNVMNLNQFYHVELKAVIHPSTGSYEVRVNGSSVGWIPAATGQNTRSSANSSANQYILGHGGGNGTNGVNLVLDIDDLVCADDFVGDKRVAAVLPSGAGASAQFLRGGTDTGANYSQTNEADADSDTTYIKSQVVNDLDSYAVTDISSTLTGIVAVCPFAFASKDDAGSRQISLGVKSGGSTADGSAQTLLLNTYFRYSSPQLTDPATSAAWAASAVNAAEVRIKEVA